MTIRKYIRKNIYRWHRLTSLMVAVPVIMWTLSGFLYPVMNSFKPNVRNQSLPSITIEPNRFKISLHQALVQNNIARLRNFRIVQYGNSYYYQVAETGTDTLTYISCSNGHILKAGDQLYAAYLAQRYLSEPVKGNQGHQHGHHHVAATAAIRTMPLSMPTRSYSKVPVKSIALVRSFNPEYKKSNVLLPVYRVGFKRNDGIRLYIETSTDRLAYAVDARRAWFNHFFSITHTWSFLNAAGKWKNFFLGTFSLLCFFTSLFGFYVYNITNKKKKNPNKTVQKSRSWHRSIGNFFLVTTLLYSLSGAWHSFIKLPGKKEVSSYFDHSVFKRDDMKLSLPVLANTLGDKEKLGGVSPVNLDGELFWQLSVNAGQEKSIRYIHTETLEELPDGDIRYGCWLACLFSGKNQDAIKYTSWVKKYNHEYNMMYKRLPVVEVSFDNDENYFVETSTGYLSAITTVSSRAERFSFSNLHMHHFWEMWMEKDVGKKVRNFVLIVSTAGLLVLVLTGILIYFKKAYTNRVSRKASV